MKKLGSLTMMCLLMLFTVVNQSSAKPTQNAQTVAVGLADFYKYMGDRVSYPAKARLNSLQGKTVFLFTVNGGKVKDLKIQTVLGDDCDGEVLNKVLAYPNFAKMSNGKYALITSFMLHGSKQPFLNSDVKVPTGYIPLELTIVGFENIKKDASTTKPSVQGYGLKGKENVLIMSSSNQFKTTDNQPMVILDDKVIGYGGLNTIDPNNIQSITILKDFVAIAKYGEEAKNGVIIIASKYFDPKKLKIQVDTLKKN